MDTRLDQNEAELGVLVLAVLLEVLAHRDGLLDQVVEVLGDLRGETVGFEDTEDLVTSGNLDLGNTVGVTENDTDAGGGQTLTSVLDDLLLDVLRRLLEPCGVLAGIGDGRSRNSLTVTVHATHDECV